MTKAGWHLTDMSAAPALLLTSDDLARRYVLQMADVMRIRNVMAQEFGGQTSVFGVLPMALGKAPLSHIHMCRCLTRT